MPRISRSLAPASARSAVAPALLALLLAPSAGCSSPQPPRETSATPSTTAEAPPVPTPAASAPASASAPAPPGAAGQAASAAPPATGPAAPPAAGEPAPSVEVKNIGMHVGGGVNDAAEKAPIKRSVDPHMEAFALCFTKSFTKAGETPAGPAKGGDFGVDLRIEKDGGKAKVSHPRTSLKADGFKECVLAVFEAIDFEKPKGGTTTVSYSLRFTPKKS